MAQILLAIQQNWPEVRLEYRQSNHEGDLIDWIQDFEGDGIVLNAGGYSHTSIALRDAVEDCAVPVVEVHISDISQREPFRRTSLLTEVCAHSIIGKGINGYEQAVNWLIDTAQH
jgi:3-dehydroquinate dehydratase-2